MLRMTNNERILDGKRLFCGSVGDVTKSPGWASVVLRLGLLCLIPIFGVVVMYGYLFSWARDIAWNVHRPLPRKIFANEDGSSISVAFSSSLLRWFFLSFQSSLTCSLACLLAFHLAAQLCMGRMCQRSLAP